VHNPGSSAGATLTLAEQGALSAIDLLAEVERMNSMHQPEQAIALYRKWLEHTSSPLAHAVYFNFGVLLNDSKDPVGAEHAYRQAIALKPEFIQAHLNLGSLLESGGRVDEALAQWRQILSLGSAVLAADKPLHIQTLNSLARLLEITRHFQEAEQLLSQSLALNPDQPHALQHWIHLRQKQCEWPIHGDLHGISKEQMLQATSALSALSAFDDPAMLLTVARGFVAARVDTRLSPLSDRKTYGHKKLRIGYLSSDFCLHPVALLTAELFELHDRDRVEVYGFCWSREDGSPLRQRIIRAMDHYVRIADMSDEAAAQCIRSHEIDILVDLHGLTSGVRPNILSRRPAPVQITYLGYPGTTAMPAIDYAIADKVVLPESLAPFFTEKPLYMPQVFQISDRQREIGPTPTRGSCGLPDDAVVYCSFNNNYKFTPQVFAAWMRILQRVPGSVLWLLADNPWAQENLCKNAELHGIDANRLIFASRVAPPAYLARYRLADLFLDTYPFNAGTTANDALWMGLPLLTYSGRTFASRMAGSLLHAVGLPELMTASLQEYEEMAVHLGLNKTALAALKRRLQENRSSFPLFDSPQFVRNLEHAYLKITSHPASSADKEISMAAQNQTAVAPQASAEQIIGDLTLAQAKVEQGLTQEARTLYQRVLQSIPNQQAALEMLSTLDHKQNIDAALACFPGPQYLDWLQWLHSTLKPASYVEIGVETGQSLRFARHPTRAVGVDPAIQIIHSQECWVKLFKLTSDDFFAQRDLRQVLDAPFVDLAFIDGLHTFDQALKDFINIERFSRPGTVVAFHDIFPVTPITAARERKSIFWLGDTWKVVTILKEMRPDLKIFTLPTFPSGLTLVTGLNAESTLLAQDVERIIERWMNVELDSYLADINTYLNVVANDFETVARLLG
jgi:predicted O-linked N-acetylglucosamine transferase (SPINDLY family)/predicted O-methyltransferase YrrM